MHIRGWATTGASQRGYLEKHPAVSEKERGRDVREFGIVDILEGSTTPVVDRLELLGVDSSRAGGLPVLERGVAISLEALFSDVSHW